MRNPLFPLVVAFILGILFSFLLHPSLSHIFIALLIVIIIIVISYFSGKKALLFFPALIAFFLAGCIDYALFQENASSNQLLKLWEEKRNKEFNQPVEIFGIVIHRPEIKHNYMYLTLKMDNIISPEGCYKIDSNISIRVNFLPSHFLALQQIEYGDYIRAITRLREPHFYKNEGCFNYKKYLLNQGISLIGSLESPLLIEVIRKGEGNKLFYHFNKLKSGLESKINQYFINWEGHLTQEGALLKSITLGDRSDLTPDFKQTLQESGVFHILAISGLHIVIISYILFQLLTFFHLTERAKCLTIIMMLLFYALLTGCSISVLRATIMSSIYLIGRVLHQESNMLNSLSLACLIILLYRPEQLFDTGFQLSFTATLFIILLAPKMSSYLKRWPLKLGEIISITLAAQMGLIPILIFNFNQISFSSPISNLIAFPFIGLIIILGILFFLFSAFSPACMEASAVVVQYFIKIFFSFISYFNKTPFSHTKIPEPYTWLIILYYFFLFLFIVFGWRSKSGKSFLISWSIIFLCIIISPFPNNYSPYLKVNFLDVGRGDSICIEFPGREKMLIDGGGFYGNISYIGENVVSPHLWYKKIKTIEVVALSHAHIDHIGGLFPLTDNFRINEIWHGNTPKNNQLFNRFIYKCKAHNLKICHIHQGFSKNINGVEVKVLNPPRKSTIDYEELNNDSLVIMLIHGHNRILLTGDIEADVERQLVKKYGKQLRCQVLKASHHGSNSSNINEFIKAVQPKIVVISGSLPYNTIINKDDSDSTHIFQRYLTYRTTEQGQITIISDGKSLQIKTYSELR
jgi:competence protein ComEC